ncbi:Amino acid-binding protein [Candidatus Magnetomoraceae bacterium gMMP-15]
MIRTEISLFLKNAPGELGTLASILGGKAINIDALTIQDASNYLIKTFKARGKSIKRIASASSYNSMQKDSENYALIRLLVDDTDKAIALFEKKEYIFDTAQVIALELENKPGVLAETSRKFGEAGININYVYGSASSNETKYLFVFSTNEIERAMTFFKPKS